MKSIFMLLTGALTLSACGSTSTAPIVDSPSEVTSGLIARDIIVVRDPTANTLTLSNGVASTTLPNAGAIFGSPITRFNDGSTYALFAETASGGGQVLVAFNDNTPMHGTSSRRLVETILPTSGTAVYIVDYAGRFLNTTPGGLATHGVITGSMGLATNFSTNSINGVVVNRVLRQGVAIGTGAGGFPARDVLLLPTAIDNNANFAGTAVGGGLPGIGTFTSNGTFAGQIVGANGTEVVGGLFLKHHTLASDYIEIGGFLGGS